MVLLALFLAVVYRFGPCRKGAKWQWISWGSVFASVTWLLASLGFSYYVANFGSYNKTYGSLGAAIGFLDLDLDLGDHRATGRGTERRVGAADRTAPKAWRRSALGHAGCVEGRREDLERFASVSNREGFPDTGLM